MKTRFLSFLSIFLTHFALAQEILSEDDSTDTFPRISLLVTVGSPSMNLASWQQASIEKLRNVNVGMLNVSYRLTRHFSAGINWSGSLGNQEQQSQYYEELVEDRFHFDRKSHGHIGGNRSIPDRQNNREVEMPGRRTRNDHEKIHGNIMGAFTYKFPEGIPLFLQAAGGYAIDLKVPVYSAMLGYQHKIVERLGVLAGVRFSDIIDPFPTDFQNVLSTYGLKAEVGLSWNF